jgi:hypothetical protein
MIGVAIRIFSIFWRIFQIIFALNLKFVVSRAFESPFLPFVYGKLLILYGKY